MPAVQFYHLLSTPLERALPKLLEKAYAAEMRTLVVTGSEERMDYLNQLLWTYDAGSFLPHGSSKDGHSEHQPVLLSTQIETTNQPRLLVVTDGTMVEAPEHFERIIDLFDGNDNEALTKARQRWMLYKNNRHPVTYMRQTPQGGWEQKASA